MDNGNLNFEAQEMETDNDHTTFRLCIAMVQIIVFIEYTDAVPHHWKEHMVEKLWKAIQFGLVFWITYSRGSFWCPLKYLGYHVSQGMTLAPTVQYVF